MVNVLQELSALDGGGVAKLLIDYYKEMNHEKIHFDFLIYDFYENGLFEKPLKEMGCRIFKITAMNKNKRKCLYEMEEVFANNNYDVFHSHIGPQSMYSLNLAKKYGVSTRFVHSHIAQRPEGLKARCSIWFQDQISKWLSTQLYACGKKAAIMRWGKFAYKTGQVQIMTNAINTKEFCFSEFKRQEIRKELGVEDKYVLGIVGRLSEQKNYPFLFKVYKEILKTSSDTILIVIGRGLEENEIKRLASEMHIANKILFLGIRDDVSRLLNAIDVFVLPSLYEGLPVVLVEAQANGLQEVVSDNVTSEVAVTDLIHYKKLDDEKEWANDILKLRNNKYDRVKYEQIVKENGYGIEEQALKMQEAYISGGCNK